MAIRVACVGGGPGGLFFSTLLKRARPDVEVVLFERNRPTDVFGFGVVFSDRTLERIDAADPVLHDALAQDGVHWDSIAVRLQGETHAFAGNGMAAIHRRLLLELLQRSAAEAGVDLRYRTPVDALSDLDDFDVVVAADGTNSRLRTELEPALGSSVEVAAAKFIWFGTTHPFDRLTFVHERGEQGPFAAHAYPIGGGISTFIVETDEATWRASDLAGFDPATPPGASDEVSRALLEAVFADAIDGAPLIGNNSRWANFRTRRTAHWHAGNVALLGDAIHTAHFSVGSGTKMAMEDAIALAAELAAELGRSAAGDVEGAFARYEAARKPEVARVQDAAGPSLSWWEHFGFYSAHLAPLDFAFHFFSRSIDIERVRRRDPELAGKVDARWASTHGAAPLDSALQAGSARFTSRRLRLESAGAGSTLSDPAGTRLPSGAFASVVAPEDDRAAALLVSPAGTGPVLVTGGTPLTRGLVAERLRLVGDRVAIIADDDLSDAAAATLILSGRADAVARREPADARA